MRSRKQSISKNYPPMKDIKWALYAKPEELDFALFDLRIDPEERNNVAYTPEYRSLALWFRNKLGNIVLGDNRIECDWKAPLNTYAVSDFAVGSDNKKLEIPSTLIPSHLSK